MYIEFRLPQGAGGMAAGHALYLIKQDIHDWVERYSITDYRTKIHKYTFRLCLATDKDYTSFALTWNPKHSASQNFKFVNPK
jgi:hypothetical protein